MIKIGAIINVRRKIQYIGNFGSIYIYIYTECTTQSTDRFGHKDTSSYILH